MARKPAAHRGQPSHNRDLSDATRAGQAGGGSPAGCLTRAAQVGHVRSQAERKRETHRKILVGAMVLDQVERGKWPEKSLKAALDRFLEREQDRALFELPPRPANREP